MAIKSNEDTRKRSDAAASKVLRRKAASKAVKTDAGLALTQRANK